MFSLMMMFAFHFLFAAKYSVPTINPSPEKMTQNTDGTLTCQSDGGYPEGILRWFDGDNMEWTKSSEMTVTKTEKGLFHLSSTLTLLRGSIFSKYTCVVFNASGDKEDEVMFEIAEVQKHEGKCCWVPRLIPFRDFGSILLHTFQPQLHAGSCFTCNLKPHGCHCGYINTPSFRIAQLEELEPQANCCVCILFGMGGCRGLDFPTDSHELKPDGAWLVR